MYWSKYILAKVFLWSSLVFFSFSTIVLVFLEDLITGFSSSESEESDESWAWAWACSSSDSASTSESDESEEPE